jgi:hypothetical protein
LHRLKAETGLKAEHQETANPRSTAVYHHARHVSMVLDHAHAAVSAVDVCFTVDATESMKYVIEAVKSELELLIKVITAADTALQTVRVAVVAYRDIADKKRFEILPFTIERARIRYSFRALLSSLCFLHPQGRHLPYCHAFCCCPITVCCTALFSVV